MLAFLKILRPINLAIIAITQIVVFYCIIKISCIAHEVIIVLDGLLFPLFLTVTLILAGTANIINDITDQEVDTLNKKASTYIGISISSKNAKFYYWILLCLGGVIAYIVANKIDRTGLVVIYPFAALLLYLYSVKLKSVPLLGNIIVSMFCALVPTIVWYAEADSLFAIAKVDQLSYDHTIHLLSGFAIFSFLSNLIREIIKDIEDIEGDRHNGINTFAVVYGIERAKILAMFNILLLFIICIAWLVIGWKIYFSGIHLLISVILLLLPPVILFFLIYRTNTKTSFTSVSAYLKVYMALGLLVLMILA